MRLPVDLIVSFGLEPGVSQHVWTWLGTFNLMIGTYVNYECQGALREASWRIWHASCWSRTCCSLTQTYPVARLVCALPPRMATLGLRSSCGMKKRLNWLWSLWDIENWKQRHSFEHFGTWVLLPLSRPDGGKRLARAASTKDVNQLTDSSDTVRGLAAT